MKHIIQTSQTITAALSTLGWKNHEHNRVKLRNIITKNGWKLNSVVDWDHPIGNNGVWKTTTPKILAYLIEHATTWRDVARNLGLGTRGSTIETIKQHAERLDISVSHFTGKGTRQTKTNDELFVRNSTSKGSTVKQRIIKHNLIEYKCSECSQPPWWNNKPLVLQLEHIDGDPTNNELTNLTFLCGHCHSQTATWGRKLRNKQWNSGRGGPIAPA